MIGSMACNRPRQSTFVLALAFFGLGTLSQTRADPTPEIEARIQRIESAILPPVLTTGATSDAPSLAERMAALRVPGVSVAVLNNGAIEWARGFGVTKIGGPAVSTETLFQAGSISKPVAATAVLYLVQSGKLDLDTDVNQYLVSWKLPANPLTDRTKVTLRHLLTHTGGLTVHGFPGYAAGATVPTLVQVLDGEPPANTPAIRVDTAPGTIWRYSGGGYTIAQQVVIDVTGKPFPEALQATVLAPLGMNASTYEQPLPESFAARAATPYGANGRPIEGGAHTYPEMAAAGLWTTASDLARFALAVQSALAGKETPVLTQAMTRRMLTPGMGDFGLGLRIGGSAERPYFGHDGSDAGFVSSLIAYNDGSGAVILTNSQSGGQLAAELLRTIAREYGWPDFQPRERRVAAIDPALLESYVGYYKASDESVRMIVNENGSLYLRAVAAAKLRLYPENDRDFFVLEGDATFTFAPGDSSRAAQLTTRAGNGPATTAQRIAESDPLAVWTKSVFTRVDEKRRDPTSEAALRRNIEELRNGAPSYEKMSPQLAAATRQQLDGLKKAITDLGAVQDVTFVDVGPGGADIYRVMFANGASEWRILMGPNDTLQIVTFRLN
jgi:CubicO group peptidase (beta-lactamase class C family)